MFPYSSPFVSKFFHPTFMFLLLMRNFLVQSIEIQKRVGSFSVALDTINKCLSEAICSLFRGRLDGESRTSGLIHSGNEILETYTYYPDVRWNYYLLFPCSHISLLGLWDCDILKLCMIFQKWTFSSCGDLTHIMLWLLFSSFPLSFFMEWSLRSNPACV